MDAQNRQPPPQPPTGSPFLARRQLLFQLGSGLGCVALTSLLHETDLAAAEASSSPHDPLAARPPHLAPRAKACIFLLMEGGPSHVDTFDPKPALDRLHGKSIERSDKLRSAQTSGQRSVVRSPFSFRRRGISGVEVSDLFAETGALADDLAIVRSVHADSDNHPAALFQLTTGALLQGSPSMGAWAVYGLGTLNRNLPAFVVLRDGRPFGGTAAWASGYLPAHVQGTQFRGGPHPIVDLRPPAGVDEARERRNLELLGHLERGFERRLPHHPEVSARLAAYELAFRMQAEVPEAVSLDGESAATRALYGLDQPHTRAFGERCLLARRLIERGVRFVQVWASGWDSHEDVEGGHRNAARQVDRPIAGLLRDLKQRGLLDETLVIWGGEFGRTPDTRDAPGKKPGRDHNPGAMTMWFAGAGVRGGTVIGATDDVGTKAVVQPYHLRDVHATFLHLLGLDEAKLTYYHAGRFKRLTDTGGEIIQEML